MTGRRIAVVGSGVSGMTASYVLSHTDYVTIFEADSRLGGHADTHLVTPPSGPPVGVDTGFVVYNEHTYPLITRLFAELGFDEVFGRMWDFYLSYSEAGFLAGYIDVSQLTLARI